MLQTVHFLSLIHIKIDPSASLLLKKTINRPFLLYTAHTNLNMLLHTLFLAIVAVSTLALPSVSQGAVIHHPHASSIKRGLSQDYITSFAMAEAQIIALQRRDTAAMDKPVVRSKQYYYNDDDNEEKDEHGHHKRRGLNKNSGESANTMAKSSRSTPTIASASSAVTVLRIQSGVAMSLVAIVLAAYLM